MNNKKTVKIQLPVTRLKDVAINFLSIVDRPANRTPFKIIKSETPQQEEDTNSMSNPILRMFGYHPAKVDKEPESIAPQVAAVIVKSEVKDQYTDSLTKAGISLDNPVESDGVVVYWQVEPTDIEKFEPVKYSNDVGALVDNIEKRLVEFPDSSDFGENVSSMSFVPGLFMSVDALHSTLFSVLEKNLDAADTKARMKTAVQDFASFIADKIDGLPDTSLQLERLEKAEATPAEPVQDVIADASEEATQDETIDKAEHTCEEGFVWNAEAGACVRKPEDKKESKKEEVKKEEDAQEASPEAVSTESTEEDKKPEEVTKEEGAKDTDNNKVENNQEEVTKSDEAPTPNTEEASDEAVSATSEEEIAKAEPQAAPSKTQAIDEILKAEFTALRQQLETVVQSNQELKAKVGEVETVAKSAQSALKGTTRGSNLRDEDPQEEVTKSEGTPREPYANVFNDIINHGRLSLK